MKERPKRNIVMTYTKRNEYKYYDSFSVKQRARQVKRDRAERLENLAEKKAA